jgi:hypothetical protein
MTGRRFTVALMAVSVALLAASTALGGPDSVRRVALTSPVRTGDEASLTVNVAPRARCTIEVIYDTVVSKAKGLNPKSGGRITWRWRVGTNTRPGRWPIIVRCGQSGTLRLKIRVLPG